MNFKRMSMEEILAKYSPPVDTSDEPLVETVSVQEWTEAYFRGLMTEEEYRAVFGTEE